MLVRAAEERDRAAALETLAGAFVDDPMLRYLAPDDDVYPTFAQAFFGYFFDVRAFGGGEVRVTDDVSAVSLWNPPGGNRLDAATLTELWDARVAPTLGELGLEHMSRLRTAVDSIGPNEPHWYLGIVGVRRDRHGQGLGGAVIRAILDDPVATGDPAYLVTGTERNLAIYRRLGFEVVRETDIGDGPHLWGMWRPASP